jgi:hypothetical protein
MLKKIPTVTGKKRAVLLSFRLVPGRYPDSASLLQPAFDSASLTYFIAGPLAIMQKLSRPEIG